MAARSIREEEEARADSCWTLFDSCWTLADIILLLLLEDSCFCVSMLLLEEDSCFCESKLLVDSCCPLIWPMLAKDTDSRACEDDLR